MGSSIDDERRRGRLRGSIVDELLGIFVGDRFHGLPATFESLETLKQQRQAATSAVAAKRQQRESKRWRRQIKEIDRQIRGWKEGWGEGERDSAREMEVRRAKFLLITMPRNLTIEA